MFQKKKILDFLSRKLGLVLKLCRKFERFLVVFLHRTEIKRVNPKDYKIVSERHPTDLEWRSMLFGWRVVRHVKSNAIVYAGDERTLGVGAGQMARVDSSRIAVWKAGNQALVERISSSIGCIFSFPDGLLAAADVRCTAAIQPGGSVG